MKVQLEFLVQIVRITVRRFFDLLHAYQWWLFAVTCLGLGIFLCIRVWPLRLLYFNSVVRTQTQQSLRNIADAHGWLLSDMELVAVSTDEATVYYHEHRRGADRTLCETMSLASGTSSPCQ